MPYIKFFTSPNDNYSDYLFWRTWHQEKAVLVMLSALLYAVSRLILQF